MDTITLSDKSQHDRTPFPTSPRVTTSRRGPTSSRIKAFITRKTSSMTARGVPPTSYCPCCYSGEHSRPRSGGYPCPRPMWGWWGQGVYASPRSGGYPSPRSEGPPPPVDRQTKNITFPHLRMWVVIIP